MPAALWMAWRLRFWLNVPVIFRWSLENSLE
jgi:hypothetical protein